MIADFTKIKMFITFFIWYVIWSLNFVIYFIFVSYVLLYIYMSIFIITIFMFYYELALEMLKLRLFITEGCFSFEIKRVAYNFWTRSLPNYRQDVLSRRLAKSLSRNDFGTHIRFRRSFLPVSHC